ncbi:MAG: YihA family ribosome biogenesis GTP-binding protein [Desulfovibrionaceae bacterium]|nr:YihA family ribosome biogenesis GTP-binding protein [Desulfovibrionaceae bacterium]
MALSVKLTCTAFTTEQLLSDAKAKIVFAGRSNVGKSSLLNALFGQKLAKISSTPGKTQSINYYELTNQTGYLVDLPGYGYAKASFEQRRVWSNLLDVFFQKTSNITLVCVLIDSRLPPQEKDLDMISFSQSQNLNILGILTKTDKCSNKQIKDRLNEWSGILRAKPLPTSSKNKSGIDVLARTLSETLAANSLTNES